MGRSPSGLPLLGEGNGSGGARSSQRRAPGPTGSWDPLPHGHPRTSLLPASLPSLVKKRKGKLVLLGSFFQCDHARATVWGFASSRRANVGKAPPCTSGGFRSRAFTGANNLGAPPPPTSCPSSNGRGLGLLSQRFSNPGQQPSPWELAQTASGLYWGPLFLVSCLSSAQEENGQGTS